jgi:leader peptidase (prepilin peptidase)/N-methyltransferase
MTAEQDTLSAASRSEGAGWLGTPVPWPTDVHRAAALGIGVALAAAELFHFGIDARGLIGLLLVVGLVALGAIDLEHGVIPNRIVVPLIAAVLVLQLAFFSGRSLEWLAAGFGAALVLGIPAFFRPGSVGAGDVKLAFLIGVGLGREVILALFLGSLASVPFALWILARRGLEARKETIPLGPFLAAGAILALFLGGSL